MHVAPNTVNPDCLLRHSLAPTGVHQKSATSDLGEVLPLTLGINISRDRTNKRHWFRINLTDHAKPTLAKTFACPSNPPPHVIHTAPLQPRPHPPGARSNLPQRVERHHSATTAPDGPPCVFHGGQSSTGVHNLSRSCEGRKRLKDGEGESLAVKSEIKPPSRNMHVCVDWSDTRVLYRKQT